MPVFKENLKDFFEDEKGKITTKIEKTSMEKFFVVFLIIIMVSTVVLTYFQFKKDLESPFYKVQIQEQLGGFRLKYNIDNLNVLGQADDSDRLKTQDSDLDGLNDYEEQYIFKTSPHLEDSDGDGIWDKQEVLAGTDPTCPTGEDCSTPVITSDQSEFDPTPVLPGDLSALGLDLNASDLVDIEEKLLSGEITLEDLGINDPDLQATFDQYRTGQPSSGESNDITIEEKQQALESLRGLSIEELREELINRGVDKATLDQIDDKTLQDSFLQTLDLYQ